jgi:Lrp/AsnC family transcriptional regulator, leucine-responsive regulatory protein
MTLYHNGTRHHLDEIDWHILRELQMDARLSYSELGRRINLSSPAVQERVRKLEDAGVIKGYRAELDLEQLGLSIKALVQLSGSCRDSHIFVDAIDEFPQILQCHHVLGDRCFYLLVAVASMKQLEALLLRLKEFGETSTTIILSTPLEQGIISPENWA